MDNKKITKSGNAWANVVIAMLSVNRYPIERTFELFNQLDANGLFDPHNLASWNHSELFKKLEKSGYKRGDVLIGLLTERLLSLGSLAKNMQANEKILANGNIQEVTDLLSQVKGIGPVVLKNFLLLRGK
jgi:3-methyladenine DNA glycosylase/8-oxoguanine DNA glycosylase